MKKSIVIVWLIFLFAGVTGLFWYNDWVYSLPTPVPEKFKPISLGRPIHILWKKESTEDKPVFLHFFNPDCPCSRFNVPHFKSLVKLYGSRVSFAIVPITDKKISIKEIQDRFGSDIPVLLNSDIAKTCGVYSTPQAVIIDTNEKLYYRGNYNKSRFCSDKKTEYARIALEALMNERTVIFDPIALKAYGCKLPLCNK
jgi:hypothetical protein